jgi:hypothetical protein
MIYNPIRMGMGGIQDRARYNLEHPNLRRCGALVKAAHFPTVG